MDTLMGMLEGWYRWVVPMTAASLFPAALLFVRQKIRKVRQRSVKELSAVLFPGQTDTSPSLDFVRARYDLPIAAVEGVDLDDAKPVTLPSLAAAAIPYVMMSCFGFTLLFVPFADLTKWPTFLLRPAFFWSSGAYSGMVLDSEIRAAAAIASASFLGGYLFSVRILLRAVQNYELNQLVFLRMASHLAFGLVTTLIVYRTFHGGMFASGIVGGKVESPGLWLGFGFLGGIYPELGMAALTSKLGSKLFKAIDRDALTRAKSVPLQVIDGIDRDTADRLDQAGMSDIQNLAVANPLLLYVETPFALYETFDWVLQAQLCLAVGPARFAALRSFNIRTSFDLERAILSDTATDAYLSQVGALLFCGGVRCCDGESTAVALDSASLRHAAMVMLDDLHIHRLRQLWRLIHTRIGSGGHGDMLYASQAMSLPANDTSAYAQVAAPPPPALGGAGN